MDIAVPQGGPLRDCRDSDDASGPDARPLPVRGNARYHLGVADAVLTRACAHAWGALWRSTHRLGEGSMRVRVEGGSIGLQALRDLLDAPLGDFLALHTVAVEDAHQRLVVRPVEWPAHHAAVLVDLGLRGGAGHAGGCDAVACERADLGRVIGRAHLDGRVFGCLVHDAAAALLLWFLGRVLLATRGALINGRGLVRSARDALLLDGRTLCATHGSSGARASGASTRAAAVKAAEGPGRARAEAGRRLRARALDWDEDLADLTDTACFVPCL